MSNLGWKFYRDYYLLGNGVSVFSQTRTDDEQETLFRRKNEPFLSARFDSSRMTLLKVANADTFRLKTIYPGLASGTGISHGSKLTGEYKLGFQFDHTTGLPVLPGSSVKGRLRSVFPNRLRQQAQSAESTRLKEKLRRKADQKEKYLLALIQQICGVTLTSKQLHQLEWAIFEGVDLHFNDAKPDYDNSPRLAVYDCDVFFDAYISQGDEAGHFLGNDYITPHKHKTRPELDPFVNPIPVQFLKVLPEVEWTFQFGLKPTSPDEEITLSAAQKKDLFQAILLDWGIGAKTNVGYGQFEGEHPFGHSSPTAAQGQTMSSTTIARAPFFKDEDKRNYQLIDGEYYLQEKFQKGRVLKAILMGVDRFDKTKKTFKLLVKGPGQEITLSGIKYPDTNVPIGTEFLAKIAGLKGKNNEIDTINEVRELR